jgi:hypothetical protein
MTRSTLAFALGLIVMVLMVLGLEFIGHRLWPIPAGLDLSHPAAMEALINMMPPAAFAWVLFAYAAASFLGAGTAATISKDHKRGVAIVVGVVMLALVAATLFSAPHPLWMVIVGVLIPLPCALLGWRVFR